MPGRAVQPPGHGDGEPQSALAPVVSLSTRRPRKGRGTRTLSPAERAAQYWEQTLREAGLEGFDAATTPAEMMHVIGPAMERLIQGLVYVRHGGGPRNLPRR